MNYRILLVEDDLPFLNTMSRCLKKMDSEIEVVCKTTGEEALISLQTTSFDLIIADYDLAGDTDGFFLWEVCQEKCLKVPFFIMSGTSIDGFLRTVESRKKCPSFLTKPFNPMEFRELVRDALYSRAAA